MALAKTEDGWLLQTMMADVDPHEPKYPSWEFYDYGEVVFISEVVAGEQFSTWLAELKGEARGYRFQIPPLREKIYSERYTSRTDSRHLYRLPYPFALYPVEFQNSDTLERRSHFTPLVKEGLPSFPNFGTALYRFF